MSPALLPPPSPCGSRPRRSCRHAAPLHRRRRRACGRACRLRLLLLHQQARRLDHIRRPPEVAASGAPTTGCPARAQALPGGIIQLDAFALAYPHHAGFRQMHAESLCQYVTAFIFDDWEDASLAGRADEATRLACPSRPAARILRRREPRPAPPRLARRPYPRRRRLGRPRREGHARGGPGAAADRLERRRADRARSLAPPGELGSLIDTLTRCTQLAPGFHDADAEAPPRHAAREPQPLPRRRQRHPALRGRPPLARRGRPPRRRHVRPRPRRRPPGPHPLHDHARARARRRCHPLAPITASPTSSPASRLAATSPPSTHSSLRQPPPSADPGARRPPPLPWKKRYATGYVSVVSSIQPSA